MRLSANFGLSELCRSDTAERIGVINQVTDPVHLSALRELCLAVLQPLRDLWGSPVRVTSGYRRPALNEALGGSRTSQHLSGEAADITVGTRSDNLRLMRMIIDAGLPYDQLIDEFEGQWLHVSHCLEGEQRGQILEARRDRAGRTYYTDVTKQYR